MFYYIIDKSIAKQTNAIVKEDWVLIGQWFELINSHNSLSEYQLYKFTQFANHFDLYSQVFRDTFFVILRYKDLVKTQSICLYDALFYSVDGAHLSW